MSSAAEAELGTLYINCREAIPACHELPAMEHLKLPTMMQTDNTTVLEVINNTIALHRTKSMETYFHWLCCRERQLKFRHYWRLGSTNKGDYAIKHRTEICYMMMHSQFLTPKRTLDSLRQKAHDFLTRSTARVC